MIFTAGGFYIYVRMSIRHIEEKQEQDRTDANAKADKNFETLDCKIEKNHRDLLADISGVGAKVGRIERDGLRRYHNTSVAMMLTVAPKDEGKVAGLLKEEN